MVEKEYELLSDEVLEKAADCLKVMGHTARLRIVNLLMQGEYSVNQIAQLCRLHPNQACEHLRLMKNCGYLTSRRAGRTVYYQIASPQLPGLIECIRLHCRPEQPVQ
ncbi:MAG TPA: metalloregulator ArsR/SmtB family transcription factor [Anaerohalosphaeraceae bacterium]|nr:metalloregulator ArsR/SmtB family transcription factor [Anaerohalosphaeraceae bacterium]HOL31840.1 metalloregulator ArsR/SmtB family transcription factor [Anaerohalosphaeraceae bacterium]HOM77379.1 metalloregulator ArsR/SmtB family transcription factor [Anaerohalosphaeraceae bacterium]HPC65614.1 metalloregulator ArsR/SmtB family transcription factor [Anaerohalosphaeraceae bacterium]HPO70995.1 metalloregulator ArsR/SmtB family transcription factor [Anaerohalosphaeraceae bacterium]